MPEFLIGVYAVVGVLVFLIVLAIDDPYRHASDAEDEWQALIAGAFWAPLLLYLIGVIVVYSVQEWLDPRD